MKKHPEPFCPQTPWPLILPSTPHSPLSTPCSSWDIFCAVVDNYGDIGVCWRLARQLAGERRHTVRLWVDDLTSFARLCPDIDPALEGQACRGVEVRRWPQDFPEVEPGDVVIEAFACALPESFIKAMAARTAAPRWINLEYLSAEDWVTGCHGLPSPHLSLLKYFFFPGFVTGTGGLLLEDGLLQERTTFQADEALRAAFWRRLDVPSPHPGELRVSLFSYANSATPGLFEAWAASDVPVTCLVPEGTATAALVAAEFDVAPAPGSVCRRGGLEVRILPFLEQPDYDRLLWACDVNFVRGEDSFVRAQWAARPFVWHIYPQEEDAHHVKMEAFLDVYCADLPGEAAGVVRGLWRGWNGVSPAGIGEAWRDFQARRPALAAFGPDWAGRLADLGGLTSNLEKFVNTRL